MRPPAAPALLSFMTDAHPLPHRAIVALGSNLRSPEGQVRGALSALATLPGLRLTRCSPLYRTAPVGYLDQPDFINGVVEVETCLPPLALLQALQAVEQQHGRQRTVLDGPRTLDLDLIAYDELVLETPELTLPHPRAHQRAFVLQPLADIRPDFVIPGQGPVRELLARCAEQGIALA